MHVHAIIYLSVLFVPVNQSINQSIKNHKTSETIVIANPYENGNGGVVMMMVTV